MSKLTLDQRFAAWFFQSKRADYYEHLANLFRSGLKPLGIFQKEAERYAGTSRGTLSALWDQRFEASGADLRATWQGCFPEGELLVLALISDGDSGALADSLDAMARIARTSQKVASEAVGTLGVAVFGMVLAALSITLLPIVAVNLLKDSMDIPVEFWQPVAKSMLHWSEWVSRNGILVLMVIAAGIAAVAWSVPNLIGPGRGFLDKHIVLYRVARDVQATRFLMLMAELTRPRGNRMTTLKVSLETIYASTGNPWLRWKLDLALQRMAATGGTTLDFLDTGLLPQEMFWYLRDMEEANKDTSKAFAKTAEHIDTMLLPAFAKALQRVRWAVLLGSICVIAGSNGWILTTSKSMEQAATNYNSTQ